MKLTFHSLSDRAAWAGAGVDTPAYDIAAMAEATRTEPVWVHFGAGNIFRGFVAALQHRLLNQGLAEKGIIAVETFDQDIPAMIYAPHDNLTLNVQLNADATIACEIVASVAETIAADPADGAARNRLAAIFSDPGLQMASFTITEKGYALASPDGSLISAAREDMERGPAQACHAMGLAAGLLHRRYLAGRYPLAMVSMDNCSRNGEKLRNGILETARAWRNAGLVDDGFIDYLTDGRTVSFPWSMIDKITPRPSPAVQRFLQDRGIEGMAPVVTGCGTYIAPFVNAESTQYLVLEDRFPNGRPPLERAGVYMVDRDTVNRTERMKVATCLNPLHTAMSVYGCLLGYTLIADEMKDRDIVRLLHRLGYGEGLPVVTDPGILSPHAFLDEVMEARLPNPFIPDTPQRIATDTSQKMGIRFGETIQSYAAVGRTEALLAIPLVIAGWFRYLLGVDDRGEPMALSPDPMLDPLQDQLFGILWNDPSSYSGQLDAILSNEAVFGLDLKQTAVGEKTRVLFVQLLAGPGAVRDTLRRCLSPEE